MSSTRVGGSIDSLGPRRPGLGPGGGGGRFRRGVWMGWFFFFFFFFFLSGRDRGSVGGGAVEGVVRLVNPILNHQGSQHSDILENHICAEGGGGVCTQHTHTHTHTHTGRHSKRAKKEIELCMFYYLSGAVL